LEHESFGFFSAVPAGISYGLETLSGYVRSLKLLFSSTGAGQIGGFGAIGGLFSPTWDWQVFWNMTAFLSIILAFMNILPIPALDGGHVVFLLYEMVTGRPPNQRVLEVAQMVGMVLLLGLILFANGNDLFKALTGR
jgi:regulator of sigma E protease